MSSSRRESDSFAAGVVIALMLLVFLGVTFYMAAQEDGHARKQEQACRDAGGTPLNDHGQVTCFKGGSVIIHP